MFSAKNCWVMFHYANCLYCTPGHDKNNPVVGAFSAPYIRVTLAPKAV
jgi:hypothetical protein